MTEILVVGFPKSGNTWLTRLLSAALDWPVRGIGAARPLAEQGEDHKDGHVIRQLHLLPKHEGPRLGAVPHQYTLNIDAVNGHHKIVHIIRDPRDVAVAVDHYWGIKNLHRTITGVLATGEHPLWGCGWIEYVEAWRAVALPVIETRYERLHEDAAGELARILNQCGLSAAKPISDVVEQESFAKRRALIAGEAGEKMSHGKGSQLNNMRAGRVGDWRTEFSGEDIAAFAERFTPQLLTLGYETDPEWHLIGVQTC